MSEIKLPFGLRLDGRMVDVDAVPRGLECGCICPACKARLVAVHGEVLRHHFRHFADDVTCRYARETALHQFAKQIICEGLHLDLPNDLGQMQGARMEVWLDGIKPDVLAQYASEEVAIEIHVAHWVPVEKIEKIAARKLATLEIDLQYYRDRDLTEDELREAVVFSAGRRWLFPPLVVRQAQEAALAELRERARLAQEAAAQAAADRVEAERRGKLELTRKWEAWQLEQAERDARRLVEEAKQRARLAEEEAARAERRREAEEVRQRSEALRKALREAEEAVRRPPDLQKLVAAYGGYDKITPEAWARHDADMARWRASMRGGTWYEIRHA